ncbi:hypothetical protein [Bacteroides sp.]|uniref:hypothetical protein n=1 Tax=Bacteroides sp. TaxID=29523 RepID=UPI002614EF2B|nr:hypothetical protein [Bacteroides sp.]MDD3037139.1 hypothetical protein [Bacteroides sp.]
MQQKEIKYTGITSTPSDYDCPDGDISTMINLINENGNLVPVNSPETIFTLENAQKIVYIHKTSDYCNYIIHNIGNNKVESKISYFTENPANTTNILSLGGKKLYEITSIGNTLVILTDNGLIYALYKSGSYETLGNNPPFPSISFRLKGKVGEIKKFTIKFKNKTKYYKEITSTNPFDQKNLGLLFLDNPTTSEAIYANINPDSEAVKASGGFQFDFMLRYAYQLYDGSLSMHSVPIYMNAGDGTPYLMKVESFHNYVDDNGSDNIGKYSMIYDVEISMHRLGSRLYYQICNFDEIKNEMEKWKDIIKDISVFITPPCYYMDQNYQPVHSFKNSITEGVGDGTIDLNFTMSIGRENNNTEIYHKIENYAYIHFTEDTKFIPVSIKANAGDGMFNFHHICSINIKNLESGEKLLPLESGILTELIGRKQMTGDSQKNGTIVARYAFTYNSRLNLANITIIPQITPLESCCQYINGEFDIFGITEIAIHKVYKYKAYIFIKSEKQDIMIDCTSTIEINIPNGSYFFYPDPKAYKLIIEREDSSGNKTYSNNKLEEHQFLNGAYNSAINSFVTDFDTSILHNTSRGIPYYNKIYTSEINNPFSFPSTGVKTIGSGEILGIRSATKALSQGQFGQFPLYAFTDEGIWALEVSSEGTFIAKQPITRDVCNNPDSITQIDTAVLFSSDRGIMLIQGSESICISDIINEKPFDITTLRGYNELIKISTFTDNQFQYIPFKDYIKECMISYDYKNQRIILFNKKQDYSYVWSLKSKTWNILSSNFEYAINSYPDSYIMTKENTLINISNTKKEKLNGIIITRPLKLDAPDLLKTINQTIHRGIFAESNIKTVLYGSRDCINFIPIASNAGRSINSIHGSPYKYFRFAILTELSPGESISGTSIVFETKQTNKLR